MGLKDPDGKEFVRERVAVLETARAVEAVAAASADMNLIEIGSQETDDRLCF